MDGWELTEYEMERKPQEIIMDSETAISPRSLYREITCPICMDILSQTRAAPECLHRFCEKCLDKVVKKECPVCRSRLPSNKKSFREDPKFDQLIAKIHNGCRAKPMETSQNFHAPECEIVLRHIRNPQTRYLKCPENTTVDHLTKYLAIRPDGPKMPHLENNDEFKLCMVANRSEGAFEGLSGNLKLEDIRNTYNLDTNKPMELYFYNLKE